MSKGGPNGDGKVHVQGYETLALHNLNFLPKELRNLIAGGTAGMVAKSFVAPIDRIKILYQVSPMKFSLKNIPADAMKIIKHEGIPALWRGNSAMMLRVFPYSGIQFMTFDKCKRHFKTQHPDSSMSPLECMLSGSFAGALSTCMTYPLDLVRARLAVQVKQKADPRPTFRGVFMSSYRDAGPIGLFRGITPTLIGMLPYAGIAFTINEQGKRQMKVIRGREPVTMEKLIIGAIAGLVAQSLTYPIEVTRRRMQVAGSTGKVSEVLCAKTGATIAVESPKLSMVETVKELYLEQGPRGFFKGLSLNWIKGPVAFSISFTTYDLVKDWMEEGIEKRFEKPEKDLYFAL